jgi:hypothetical protein
MERYTNETQAALERAIKKFLNENKELALKRILGLDGLEIEAAEDKDININTYGTGKALYNGVEIGAGGGGVTSFRGRVGAVSPEGGDYEPWYLKLSGGTLTGGLTMMAAIDMNGYAINSLPLNRDWSTLEILDGSALCRDDIDGPSGMLNTEFLLNGIMDAGIGKIVLPHNDNVPANCVVGEIIWEPDAGRLWVGKAVNQWKEIGSGDYLPLSGGTLTGDLTINKSGPTLVLDATDTISNDVFFRRSGALEGSVGSLSTRTYLRSVAGNIELQVPTGKGVKIVVG